VWARRWFGSRPTRPRYRLLVAALAVGTLPIGLSACSGGSGRSITLYNGQHVQLTSALVDAFERQSGIHVRVLSNDAVVLANQLAAEGAASPADVYFSENTPELMALQERGLLGTLSAATLGAVPPQDSSPQGRWVGVAERVNVLVYDPSQLSASQLPASLLDLAQPQWKGKIAIAPTDSDFLPLVGAVAARSTNAQALSWLQGLKRNAVVYQDDEAVTAAVNRGAVAAGIVNQYYWYRLQLEVGSAGMHSAIHAFAPGDVGNLANISGAAVLASSHDRSDAQRFVAFLVSQRGQEILASGDDFEYPLRPGVPANPGLPPIGTIPTTPIGVVELGSDRQASALLQQAGLV
jgi:iron(III) transport system substrate-binding protein